MGEIAYVPFLTSSSFIRWGGGRLFISTSPRILQESERLLKNLEDTLKSHKQFCESLKESSTNVEEP